MSMIPDSAPFTDEQKAWLNGFFAGLLGVEPSAQSSGLLQAAGITTESLPIPSAAEPEEEEDFPWHEPELPIVQRMELAEGRPLNRKMMAAMAQLDCGTCGYLCESYSDALASGAESDLTLCSPGGKETKQMLKKLMADQGGVDTIAPTETIMEAGYTRKNPFSAKLIDSLCLNGEGSAKVTQHVVIDLAGSNLKYEVGDALGVWPTNCDELVEQVVQQLEHSDGTITTPLGNTKSIGDALREDCCLKDPSDELIELLAKRTGDDSAKSKLQVMIDDGGPVEGVDVLDVLTIAGDVKLRAQELVANTESMKPRLYSIASSMKAVGNEVHLTIGKVTYSREDRLRKGVASTMLADRMKTDDQLGVYIVPNTHGFTVPADDSKPIIMVGPGTGIAPFIAFLQERIARGASGKNWLFFGDQHRETDFLYEQMLTSWQSDGALTRLDTAFSRDGDEKVYVQNRMRENGAELWQWLTEGAYFYVCGDASRMASDVDAALVEICAQHGNMSSDDAVAFVKKLGSEKRYSRDVY